MVCMLPKMADEASAARSALDYLAQLQPGLKGSAIFARDGVLLACLGANSVWAERGAELLATLDSAVEDSVKEGHIATLSGEVFVQSGERHRLVAVAERFVLASLLSFDMRTVLRQVEGR